MSEIDDIARSLRSSQSQWQHLTESYVIGKFVNALPREYDIQKQMLEEREDGFSREVVVSSVQNRFESSAYIQLHCSKPKSADNQAFAVTGRDKNHPGRDGSRHGRDNQADHRVAVETAVAARTVAAAARAADVPGVGELAEQAVAPRSRSPGGGRVGCARPTSITHRVDWANPRTP